MKPREYVLCFFQCTVSKNHSISISGLKSILDAIPADLKKRIRETYLVFDVPESIAATYLPKSYTQRGKVVKSGDIPTRLANIPQMVLRLTDKQLHKSIKT